MQLGTKPLDALEFKKRVKRVFELDFKCHSLMTLWPLKLVEGIVLTLVVD